MYKIYENMRTKMSRKMAWHAAYRSTNTLNVTASIKLLVEKRVAMDERRVSTKTKIDRSPKGAAVRY